MTPTEHRQTILFEVYRTRSGVVTVTTDRGDGSGSRLCGVKLVGSGSKKVAEFRLDRRGAEAILEEFDGITEAGS
ncbi:MAG: hypothetical protein IPK26_25855 [Planctomycetes bacterium]|nr:hypothetical protein [Planctomycetota bacterium]